MKKTLLTGTLAASLFAAPAFAQQPSKVDQVLREVEALSKRVEKLEQENSKLSTQNDELRQTNDRLEATTEYLRDNAQATRKQLAESDTKVAKIGDLEKSAKAADWASKITWKGDLRYRHENVDPEEAITDQTRHRVRARFGLTAKINDTVSGTVQLATNGGNNDPRSTNQTLGDGLSRKGVAIDLAYVEWKPINGLAAQAGKHPYAFQRVGSYFWDGDITWEGGAVKYESGSFFGSAFGSWLSESSTAGDATLLGGQLGFRHDMGGVKLLGALSYLDVGTVQNKITTAATGCTNSPVFFGGPQGNTTFSQGGCARLLNDYNLIEAIAQAEMKIGKFPFTVFADYIQNQEADALDTGYALGFTFGKASDPKTWEFGYVYQDLEKDAQFGQFTDSDFGGGITDSKGSVFKVGYGVAKGWALNGTYFMNERILSAGQRDYDRYQLDLNYKF